MIVTRKQKIPLAYKMTRVVHGGRGDYMEIAFNDIVKENIFIPDDQQWRVSDPKWKDLVYYHWWTTEDGVKIYYQRKLVDYADYKIGYWYVAPDLVEEVPDSMHEDA